MCFECVANVTSWSQVEEKHSLAQRFVSSWSQQEVALVEVVPAQALEEKHSLAQRLVSSSEVNSRLAHELQEKNSLAQRLASNSETNSRLAHELQVCQRL